VSVRELEHLLWRYEYGRLADGKLELEMRDAVRVLMDTRAVQGSPRGAGKLVTVRDDAIGAAARAVDTRQWRDAVRAIRRGADALAGIAVCVAAKSDVDRALQEVDELRRLAVTEFLQRLPTVASLVQLGASMTQCMQDAQFRRASDLAGLVSRMAVPLLARVTTSMPSLERRSAAAAEVCTATRAVADDAEPDPVRDGSLERIRALAEEEHAPLAARLLTETEIALLGRRRFRLHFEERLRRGDVTALKTLVAQHSWHGTVDSDSHDALARQAIVLGAHADRANSVAANLDAAFR